ncbi:MAG TPA: hypothetical protein VFV35_02515 [Acidimicrobiales bacterium]|nr:hypothetical protein [Acidimicrobiales bacterium]
MTYRVVTTTTFTDAYWRMTKEEQDAELVAALDIVARNGGTIESMLALPDSRSAQTIGSFPDEASTRKAELQIEARGAFILQPQRAYPLDEWQALVDAAATEAVVGV